jgi:hypothetical protein
VGSWGGAPAGGGGGGGAPPPPPPPPPVGRAQPVSCCKPEEFFSNGTVATRSAQPNCIHRARPEALFTCFESHPARVRVQPKRTPGSCSSRPILPSTGRAAAVFFFLRASLLLLLPALLPPPTGLTSHQLHRQIGGESPPEQPALCAHCWAVAAIHGRRRTGSHARVARAAAPPLLTARHHPNTNQPQEAAGRAPSTTSATPHTAQALCSSTAAAVWTVKNREARAVPPKHGGARQRRILATPGRGRGQ